MDLPNDFNDVELELYNYLNTGLTQVTTTSTLYSQLEDPIDMFLVAYVFELKNTRKSAGEILGLSKATIWKRIKKIKRMLSNYYKI